MYIQDGVIATNNFSPYFAFLMSVLIFSDELLFLFPRNAQKIYEEVLYKFSMDKLLTVITGILILFFLWTQVQYFLSGNLLLIIISSTIVSLYSRFRYSLILIGDKSIIIREKMIRYDEVEQIKVAKNKIIVENGDSSEEYRCIIPKRNRKKVESILNEIV